MERTSTARGRNARGAESLTECLLEVSLKPADMSYIPFRNALC